MQQHTTVYEVIMCTESCYSEKSSMGIYLTHDLAKQAVETESLHYSDDAIFEIEPKMLFGYEPA